MKKYQLAVLPFVLSWLGTFPTCFGSSTIPADSSRNRVNVAVMTNVPIRNVAELNRFLTSPQTNKRALLSGTYNVGASGLQRTGAWNNVLVTAPTGATILTSGSTALLFQGPQAMNRVKLDNLTFRSTSTGGGYPMLFSNDLVSFHGWEIARCTFIGTGTGNYNAFGIIQYSTVSKSGGSSSDLYIHDCSFLNIPRMGMEILSQGYDKVRLANLTIVRNRFENKAANSGEKYRMATSLSGLITNVYHARNRSVNAKDIAYEFVNVKNALADNNTAIASLETAVGYSITDDGHNSTERITVRGGNFNMTSRPFQVYGARDVHFIGGTYLGHRGIDINCQNSTFDGLNITVHSTTVESSWQFSAACSGNTLANSVISSFGAVKAGYHPAFESVVLRSGTSNNKISRVTTRLGRKADGVHYTDGSVQNQGESTNTVQGVVVKLE
ncbi:hypothetical protein [Fibrella forsythiae]|uniref:Right-handed parallel beta-helix repeat-containing protein n=1 Tax=Fibrella forsythiae TaxID=2817061 RepID=A0ABS3JTH1_9BACT|nr:hypothetical protein [Fibrella forsythiae]MBO0952681.1 hypothetical protein [Fibrella forsythiae]